mgnify:CR=1 FL=1
MYDRALNFRWCYGLLPCIKFTMLMMIGADKKSNGDMSWDERPMV